MLTAVSMLVALTLDWLIGWPEPVFRRIGHPVTWIGAMISAHNARFNTPDMPQRFFGIFTTITVIGATTLVALSATVLLPEGVPGAILAGVLAWPLVAARAMFDHVEAVRAPLSDNNLSKARVEVAKIVGRDPETLDAQGVARATLESLAENTSDGIVAPVFWGVVFGLPGIAAYKAINTLDSMIGHRNETYRAFGWAAARTDDIANLVPARLTGVLFALVTLSATAVKVMWRDARLHRSPNAGWPEAAMAGALGVRLSGPRGYGGTWSDEPWVNEGAPDPDATVIARALGVFRRLLVALGVALVVLASL